ncbi:hypothetical protein L596_003020 [Steinernema carpocapsae]|uniref:D-isomer specific 2-hydroxyacid dehydrogenase catalytic domain-containing protein n=1 Tax=Steinernema carpocapsae TaxID=34508 RepID=A0A4U8UR52_STECR|nr:hypothetical protein L596_003020 [Steinernema carpocapsae]
MKSYRSDSGRYGWSLLPFHFDLCKTDMHFCLSSLRVQENLFTVPMRSDDTHSTFVIDITVCFALRRFFCFSFDALMVVRRTVSLPIVSARCRVSQVTKFEPLIHCELFTDWIVMFRIENVLIADEIEQECIDILKRNGVNAVKKTKQTKEQLLEELPKYDAVVVRSATKITRELIEAASGKLALIGRAGTGVDNIDVQAATEHGMIVMNTPAVCIQWCVGWRSLHSRTK